MKKQNENNELAFSSPFTLHNCVSRLRSLSRRRQWMFTILPMGGEAYYFTMSGKRHSATVGYLYRQASNTLVTIQQERNWLLLGLLVLSVLAMIPLEWSTIREVHRLFSLTRSAPSYASYNVSVGFVGVILFLELFVSAHLLRIAWHIFKGPANIARALEKSLTDAITDLPQGTFTDEDGEMLIIEDGEDSNLGIQQSQRN